MTPEERENFLKGFSPRDRRAQSQEDNPS
jgi:hypothetical protein